MNVPNPDTQKQPILLPIKARLRLIHTLNELPLSQFIELEYALDIPSGIMPPVQTEQGLRSKALLTWIEGPTGPRIHTLLDVLETEFNLSINQTKEPNREKEEEKALMAFAIAGSIDEMDEPKLRAIAALLKKVSDDVSIEIVDMTRGSIKFTVSGTPDGLERLKKLMEAGQLEAIGTIENIQPIETPSRSSNTLNLSGAELTGTDLRGAILYGAELTGADLSGAILYGADLYRADLSGADLYRANLTGADLSGADLHGANLTGANLSEANLTGANLSEAFLSEAIIFSEDDDDIEAFIRANLSGAILSRANLSRANLSRANLSGAILSGAILSNAVMTNSIGLSQQDIRDFMARGAIFEDSPEDRAPIFSSPKVPR